jgi:hypothetical protein
MIRVSHSNEKNLLQRFGGKRLISYLERLDGKPQAEPADEVRYSNRDSGQACKTDSALISSVHFSVLVTCKRLEITNEGFTEDSDIHSDDAQAEAL